MRLRNGRCTCQPLRWCPSLSSEATGRVARLRLAVASLFSAIRVMRAESTTLDFARFLPLSLARTHESAGFFMMLIKFCMYTLTGFILLLAFHSTRHPNMA